MEVMQYDIKSTVPPPASHTTMWSLALNCVVFIDFIVKPAAASGSFVPSISWKLVGKD